MSMWQPEDKLQQQVLEIGARLQEGPSEFLINTVFARELRQQLHLFEALGLADMAQTLVALELRTIPETEGRALLAALLALQHHPDSFMARPERGDLYTNREAWLATRTGAIAWLGAGRARREAITTAYVIAMRRALLDFKLALAAFGKALAELAGAHRASLIPDYTYLQAAQPSSFGHYLLSFAYPLRRDLERLDLLFAELNHSPMGCGSANGSRIPQGRAEMAHLLGFAGVIEHARDAMWQADLSIHCAALLNSTGITLSRLAEDLQIFSTQEFGLIELHDRHARASKIMPQKKNPFALTHVRAFANQMIGLIATVTATSRTPTGQPDNRLLIYGELPAALRQAAEVAALMQEVLEQLTLNAGRGRELVENGWVLASDLAEMLVLDCGLSFRTAHQLVGFLAGKLRNVRSLSPEMIVAVCEQRFGLRIELSQDQLDAALDPDLALQDRSEAGGAASGCVAEMSYDCALHFAEHYRQALEVRAFLDAKAKDLLALADTLAA